MVQTITPVVHGGRGRWFGALGLHVAGATLAAAFFGALLAGVGALLGAPWGRAGWIAVALVAFVYALGELPRAEVVVPALRRQVPDWWRTYFSPLVTAFLYGAGLGVGFLTFLTHGTLLVVSAAAIVIGDVWWGALVVGVFGFARGMSAIMARGVEDDDAGSRLVDRLVRRSDRVRRAANGIVLMAVVLTAAEAASLVREGWAELAAAVLAGVFTWAALTKVADRRRWRRALHEHRLPSLLERAAAWMVPVAEGLVPLLAVLGLRRASAGWALVILAIFSIEIVRVRVTIGRSVPCGCFGGRRSIPASTQLARNAGLAVAAGAAIAAAADAPLVRWPGVPSGAETLPAVLAAGGLLVAGWTAWRSIVWLGKAGRA